jgi:tRNA pseudouridine38-40 synthase
VTRLKLTLAYDGTDFSGWQTQEWIGKEQPRTVQAVLESAFGRILGHSVRLHASGRTDAGVHALGQIAHVDVPDERAELPWAKALNANLPDDVTVLQAEAVSPDFHARFSARSKVYAYHLYEGERRALPMRRRYVWATGPLDEAAMLKTAAQLIGKHDFKAFQNAGTPVRDTVRTVARFERSAGLMPGEWIWRVEAEGFLKQMVRNLMGLLVDVGRAKLSPDAVQELLTGCPRECAPFATAPAQGLFLERVLY